MNLAVRAALYNALLFPGWGHFYLKKYKRGLVFLLPVLAGMLAICWAVFQIAVQIVQAAPLKKGAVDIAAIVKLALQSARAIDLGYFSLLALFIVLLWAAAIIDAYLIGKKRMQEHAICGNQC